MRVLFLLRSDAGTLASGPTEQVRQYALAVTERGGEAVVHTGHEPLRRRFDVAHVFNVDSPLETARQMDIALACADRVVLSPIHHRRSWEEAYHALGRYGLSRGVAAVTGVDGFVRLRGVAQAARTSPRLRREATRQLVAGIRHRQIEMLNRPEMWIVTSEHETESIVRDFGVASKPSRVVPNGADWVEEQVHLPVLPAEFVLSVGRIETRKNQIGLARALVELGMPGVFVGVPNPRHRAYVRRFASFVGKHPSLTWLRAPSREQRLALFRRARVHALASWYEVQPLVDSEAAVAGCSIVTTTRGYSRDTLGDTAVYWEPATGHGGLVASLRSAVDRPRDRMATARFRERLSWGSIRRELAPVYGL
jgi:glycosyltransferase involved in cell wall biosynthesis